MKIRKLILCMMLSLAMIVTFIPCIAFAEDGNGGYEVGQIYIDGEWERDSAEQDFTWNSSGGGLMRFHDYELASNGNGDYGDTIGKTIQFSVKPPKGSSPLVRVNGTIPQCINSEQEGNVWVDTFEFTIEQETHIDVKFIPENFTGGEDDFNAADTIDLNGTKTIDLSGSNCAAARVLIFQPQKNGKYLFCTTDPAAADGGSFCVAEVYGKLLSEYEGDGQIVLENGKYITRWEKRVYFEAKAGRTYFLIASNYDGAPFDVTVKESDITGITFTPAGTYESGASCDDPDKYWQTPYFFESGDKLTLNTKNGSKTYVNKEITYQSIMKNFETNESWDMEVTEGVFVNTADKSDVLYGIPKIEVDEHYAPKASNKPGTVKSLTTDVKYTACSTKATIKVKFVLYHNLEKYVKAKAPTCKVAGNKAYWICSDCGRYFLDEEGQKEVTKSSLTIPKAHKWKHGKVAGGLLKNGSEYDQCVYCKAKKNTKVIPGYSEYYVKSFKVKKGKKSFTAKWKKQSKKNLKKFNGYQIRYSTNANMSKAKFATAGKKSKSKKIKGLAKKTTYYVQVRTYTKSSGTTFYSKWSAKKKVKTK